MEPDLSVRIHNIRMRNPIMPASGTFGYGKEMANVIDISKLGAVIMKTTTLKPQEGNPTPRICETAAGIINSIGLQNLGIDTVIKAKIPFLRQFDVPIIASIAGKTIKEYERLAEKLNRASEYIAGLEVNISCPNTEKGGMAFGQDAEITRELIGRVKRAASSDTTVIAKLTPNITSIVSIAKAAVLGGADALSLINTVKARAKFRRKKGLDAGKWIQGGLSGSAIKPIALSMVYEVAQADLGVPIIGIGGIRTVNDVLDFLEAGADAVQIGTANFINFEVMVEVIDGLRKYMKEKKYINITELKKGETNGSKR